VSMVVWASTVFVENRRAVMANLKMLIGDYWAINWLTRCKLALLGDILQDVIYL
jgi:hypothetical protein